MTTFRIILVAIILLTSSFYGQEKESDSSDFEIFLIDAYCKPEPPHNFILTFYTNLPAKTKVVIEEKYNFEISNDYKELHTAQIDISKLFFFNKQVDFVIISEDSLGNKFTSEKFDFDLPYEPDITGGSSLFTICLFGGFVFLLPSPQYVFQNGNNYFSLTKEIPVVSFRSKSFKYPSAYYSVEYTYIFNAENRKLLRSGFKGIIQTPFIEYISPGFGGFTNFSGQNGFSTEVTLGLFRIFDSLTLYTRYRYNLKPSNKSDFHEINLGIYSGFFSIYL